MSAGTDARRPSRLLLACEAPRSAAEFATFVLAWPAAALAPRGDGHGVLVLPGWMTGDAATAPLRRLLRRLGYVVHGWELGRNVGPTEETRRELPLRLRRLHAATGGPVSLVGMSLGGVLARRMARADPALVRRVVTLGSPFRQYEDGLGPVPVPSTAVYSRGDGIVDWRTCLDDSGGENVEVRGSHCGLGHNPLVARIVTQRLAEVPSWSR